MIIAISSNEIAKFFQKIHLPLITGTIFTGIVAGPYVLNLIHESTPERLPFINETALAFIAFAAGSELYLQELRSRINSIKWNTFGQLVVTFILGTIMLLIIRDQIPFLSNRKLEAAIVIAMLTATVFVARSPASAIAVIKELRAKGPFTQTVMGVTVLKDFLVIILFSICLSLAQTVLNGDDLNIQSLVVLIFNLGLSVALGFYAIGMLLKLAVSLKIRGTLKTILIVLIGYLCYYFSHLLPDYSESMIGFGIHLEPLLICILGSFYVTNFTKYRTEFIKRLHDVENVIYVTFFTLTGASLNILVLDDVIGVALILFLIRIITMVIGSYTGGLLAGDPSKHLHLGWTPYVTQAGVALGLTTAIVDVFPGWGEQFATVIIALIVINQLIGPPLFKWSIFRTGEDRIRGKSKDWDTPRDALIVGYEPLSLALSKQLEENGWEVQLATLEKEGDIEPPEGLKIRHLNDITKKDLDMIGADKAEAIVCMLSDEENLDLCEVAFSDYGTRDIIVRLNERSNYQKFLEYNALIVDPSTAIVSLLDHFVRSPQATSLLLGMEKGQDTRDLELLNPDLHGVFLRNLRLPSDVIILSITRGGQQIISHGYTRLRVRDLVTVVGSIESLNQVQLKFDR